jgi:Double zinc ribbon
MADLVGPAGPADYTRHPGEDVQCPACWKYNDGDAQCCDQCGSPLPAFGDAYSQKDGEIVQCLNCGKYNMPDARFCDQCGRQVPWSSYAAASVAQQAAQTQMATSSSGRDPVTSPMTPSQRTEYLRRIDARAAVRDALDTPPATGNLLRDLGAAEDHYNRVESAWLQFDQEVRDAEARLGMFPAPAELAEVAEVRGRCDAAWASLAAARAHRDMLREQEDRLQASLRFRSRPED